MTDRAEPHAEALAQVMIAYAGVRAGVREIDARLAARWAVALAAAEAALDQVTTAEIALRIELGYSKTGTVGGTPVVRRNDRDELERLL